MERVVRLPEAYSLRSSISTLGKSGIGWPLARWDDGAFYKASTTPDGVGALRLERVEEGVLASASGAGARWLLAQAHRWCGAMDDPGSFQPDSALLKDLHRRHPGLRLGHTGRVFDSVQYVIFGQVVTDQAAKASRRAFLRRYGQPAPHDLIAPADPRVVAGLNYAVFHPMNVERKRAQFLIRCAQVAHRIEEAASMSHADAMRRLLAVPGIGPWTANLVSGAALGNPDAVAYGDYHLKNTVSWHLAREPRGTDDRMMELLAPYAGHQRRVIALLHRTGESAPKYGAKVRVNDIRSL